MKEILKKVITEFWDQEPDYVSRKRISQDLAAGKSSLVIVGPRRAGKSYTVYEIRDALVKAGTESHDFIYINFEDERLEEFSKEHFDLILESYHEMRQNKPVICLDEIQNIGEWDRFIRRLKDGGYKVIATGSNSKMLSSEIAEKLGGRFPEIEVYPLDFLEFLMFKGIEFKKEHAYSKERFKIRKYFDEYLHYGGFPEPAFLSEAASKIKLIKSYFNLVFYKDIIARKNLQNVAALRFIVKKLRESIGNVITPRAIYASLKFAQINVGPNTVESYVDYLDEAFLVIACPRYAKSVLSQEKKKRYFIDNGYIKMLEVKEDLGLMLENLVFIELIKYGKSAYFYQGKKECDFMVDDLAIQVSYELNEENQEREIAGLLEAMDVNNLKKGIVITYEQEKDMDIAGKKISVIPAWKWCLSLHSS